MQIHELRRWISGARTTLTLGAALLGALALTSPARAAEMVRLGGHVPSITASSILLGHVTHTKATPLAIALPLRNQAELNDLIRRLHDPKDPLYGHYLKPDEFADRFGATQADYDAVIAFAKSKGLTVTGTHANRLLLDVSGKPADIESAFGIHLNTYRKTDGTTYFAPDANPALPASIAGKVQAVVGLSSASSPQMSAALTKPQVSAYSIASPSPAGTVGTGPMGYLSPQDIQVFYQLNDGVYPGTGQTVALFELGGFYPSDVTSYETYFNLPKPNVQAVPVLGYNGAPGPFYAQAALDIDAVLASAPGVSNILVYEAPSCDGSVAGVGPGWLAALAQIAVDDKASQVGISYGAAESSWIQTESVYFLYIEDYLFQEMAVQGQTVYVASGNNGAYADGKTLSVSSPASDPYVAAVGGTSLTSSGGFRAAETTWNDLATGSGASGGGVSSVWAIQPWQTPYVTAANQASATMRNLPDVSCVADPLTGFDVYLSNGPLGAGFYAYGGTGLASSLWVGLNAKVNQVRKQLGNGPVGLVSPSLYGIDGTGPGPFATGIGTFDYYDVADGSTNGDAVLYPGLPGYAAAPLYDLTTGLGTYIGTNLFPDLAGYSSYYAPGKNMPPANPGNVQAVAGNGYVNLSWNSVPGATGYLIYRYPTGTFYFTPIAGVHGLTYTDANLTDGTFYNYYVTAVGLGGESDYTTDPVLTAVPNPVLEPFPAVVPATGGKAAVSWQTNVLADGTVVYATNPALTTGVKTLTSKAKTINHQFNLTGLKTGTTYYLAVTDNDGLTSATSPTVSFTAL